MRIGITLLLCLLVYFKGISQDDLINTKQYIFTFDKAKVSTGIGFAYGFGGMIIPEGSNPPKADILEPLYFSGGLLFDLHSPKSFIGFAFGAEFDWQRFTYIGNHEQTTYWDEIDMQYIRIPGYLKLKFGGKFSFMNVILFGGGSIDYPFKYIDSSYLSNAVIHKTSKILDPGISAIAGLTFQFNFNGKQRRERILNEEDLYFPKMWIYLKASRRLYNAYNQDYGLDIFENQENENLDYRDLKISMGVVYFLGGNRNNSVQ